VDNLLIIGEKGVVFNMERKLLEEFSTIHQRVFHRFKVVINKFSTGKAGLLVDKVTYTRQINGPARASRAGIPGPAGPTRLPRPERGRRGTRAGDADRRRARPGPPPGCSGSGSGKSGDRRELIYAFLSAFRFRFVFDFPGSDPVGNLGLACLKRGGL
jgi:hypothetical protein